jgi:hypothetical protein
MSVPPPPPPAENLQERFRAQAGAIVAAERGLTPSCRIKLADLARQIGLDEAQAQEVLRSFGGAAHPKQSPAARKFQRDVRKTLTSLAIAALTPLHEARLLDVARKKHALSESEAEAIIAATAAELGVGRISSEEACATLDGMIADKLETDEWLDGDSRETLYKAGERWGLSPEDVEVLIRHRLEQNRRGRKRQEWLQKAAIGGAAALAVVVVLLLVAVLNRKGKEVAGPQGPGAPSPGAAEPARPKQSGAPSWWTTDLALEVALLKRSGGEFAKATTSLASDDPAQRQAAYDRLVQLVLDPERDDVARQSAIKLLATAHALEPDDSAAAAVRTAILAQFPAPDAPLDPSPQALAHIREAALLPAALLSAKGLSAERKAALQEDVQRVYGVVLGSEAPLLDRERPLRGAISQRLYRQLIHAARREPQQAAEAYPAVDSYARRDLAPADAERLEGEFLSAWLLSAGEDWTALRDRLVLYVSTCQQANLFRLLDVYQRSAVATLTEQLGRMLLLRVGAAAPPSEKKVVLAALRQALGISGGKSSATAAERWQQLAQRADELLAAKEPAKEDARGQLAQALHAAWLGNLAIMLAQGEAYHAQFDKALEQEPPVLAAEPMPSSDEPSSEPAARPRAGKRTPPRAGTPAQAELQRYAELLTRFEQHPPAQRVTAIRGLGILANTTPDISPDQAAPIARYLLAAKPDEERQQLETAVGPLRVWKHLRLAIADGLQGSRLKPEHLAAIVGPLIGREALDASDRAALKRVVLQDVLDSLGEAETPVLRGNESEQLATTLDDAAAKLTDLFRERLRTLGAASEELGGTDSPSRSLAKCVARLKTQSKKGAAKGGDLWQEQLAAAEYVAENDLRRTVFWQGLWLETCVERLTRSEPSHRSTAERIQARATEGANALAQLRARELASLQLWLLSRSE